MNDAELRFALRQLPRERTPPADGWPAIAAAIAAAPRGAAPAPPARRQRAAGWIGAALAASLLVAVLVPRDGSIPPGAPAPAETVALQGEAARLRAEYQAALAVLDAPPPPADLAPVIATLERDATAVESALHQQPDAAWLLAQQRRVYTRHLALARLLATS